MDKIEKSALAHRAQQTITKLQEGPALAAYRFLHLYSLLPLNQVDKRCLYYYPEGLVCYKMNERVDSGFEEEIDIEFLLPNGFLVPLRCSRRYSLSEVKQLLWAKVMQLPAANLLRNSDYYGFIGITTDAVEEDILESTKIEDLRLARPILEVSNVTVTTRDKLEHLRLIGEVIGMPIQSLEHSKDTELLHFRSSLREVCHRLVQKRENWGEERRALFNFPPRLDKNEDLPTCTARKIMKHPDFKITLNVWVNEQEGIQCYTTEVPAQDPPHRVIEAALTVRQRHLDLPDEDINEYAKLFVLKLRDKEEYMLQESCIHTYEYVRNCINRDQVPELQITSREELLKSIPDNRCHILKHEPVKFDLPEPTPNSVSSWQLPDDQVYRVRVRTMPVDGLLGPNMFVQAQLFHGGQPLSDPINTLDSGFNMEWNFKVPIRCLPRSARICFSACEKVRPADRSSSTVAGLTWVNMQVFDYTKKLVTGPQVFRVTNFQSSCSKTVYPFGTPGSNTDIQCSELKFEVVAPCDKEVYFPSTKEIDQILEREDKYQNAPQAELTSFELLDRIIHADPLRKMSQQETRFLWENRYLAMEYQPNILPRVVQCVRWTERHEVFELYQLLRKWPYRELSLVTTLQLLGPEYPDVRVRSLAVKALDITLTDQMLELLLLQLVQAVKLESYQNNELSRFLLCRALFNKNIGHRYFWHLRSEMHNGISRLRFAPLLEAYCLYCGSAVLDDLHTEVKSMKAYQAFSSRMKQKEKLEEQQSELKSWLADAQTREELGNQKSVVDQGIALGDIQGEKCQVMSSKQRPLWLTWENSSSVSPDGNCRTVKYIIKDGDDLRQDMLVLQLIRLMDMIWKYCLRDYWITLYECISLDNEFGIIEVVEDSKTVCDISMHKQQGVMSLTSMNEWLYTTTEGGEKYIEAVKRFTNSCAGFSVITFILGVGDRHSDNIMLKKTGELFHIDFGHFMDHRKEKFKVRRERTPFVITKDFMRIVMKGDLEGKTNEKQDFKNFVYLCLEAFLTIRRHGSLFLTLLNLMLHCDLPELQDVVDIDYCRKCLALDLSEHEAADNFYQKIIQSYKGQWMTNIDWFLHRVNRAWLGSLSGS